MPLARNRRLSGKEIRFAARNSRRVTLQFLSVSYAANNLGRSRFAVLVPASVSKYATVRNRLRRILGEAIRRRQDDIPSSYDIIFRVKQLPAASDRFWADNEVDRAIAAIKLRP